MNTKQCSRCYREFRQKRATDSYCRECRSELNQMYYLERKKSAGIEYLPAGMFYKHEKCFTQNLINWSNNETKDKCK